MVNLNKNKNKEIDEIKRAKFEAFANKVEEERIASIFRNSPKRSPNTIANILTRCNNRNCRHGFWDRWKGDDEHHKIVCPRCHHVNVEDAGFGSLDAIREFGLKHDLGTDGGLGGFSATAKEIKKFIRKRRKYGRKVV